MPMPPLPPLLKSKSGRIKVALGVGVVLIALMMFSSSDDDIQTIIAPLHPPEEVVVEKPLPPAPPNTDNSKIILDLFNPSQDALASQISNTTYSQQIEQTLTVSFVLTKCLVISQDDYRDLFRALIMYAQLTKLSPDEASAESKVREIAEAANASYALIYSRTSCKDPQLPSLATQVTQWTDVILTQK